MTSYVVTADATVNVDVHDPDVIERVTGLNGDEWRAQFYESIKTAEDVVAHFAFNALANGILEVNRLEGWGDVDPDAVVIHIEEIATAAKATT